MKRALAAVAMAWQFLRDVVTIVRPCRFSALVVAAGAILLLTGQGQELTVRLPSEGPGKVAWFYACVFLWAFQSWYWARLVLDLIFGLNRGADLEHPRIERMKTIIVRTPRWLAMGGYGVALIGCAFAGSATPWIAAGLAVQMVLFYLFLIKRTDWAKRLAGDSPGFRRSLLTWQETEAGGPRLPLLSKAILLVTVAAALGLTAWVCADAVGFAWTFGAAAVPFLGFSMIVPAGSCLVLLAHPDGRARLAAQPARFPDTRGDYPVIVLLVLLAFGWTSSRRWTTTRSERCPARRRGRPSRSTWRWRSGASKRPSSAMAARTSSWSRPQAAGFVRRTGPRRSWARSRIGKPVSSGSSSPSAASRGEAWAPRYS